MTAHNAFRTIPTEVLRSNIDVHLVGNPVTEMWKVLQSLGPTLPAGFYELADLETLNLYRNNLASIDPKIRRLKRLRKLELANNVLSGAFDEAETLNASWPHADWLCTN